MTFPLAPFFVQAAIFSEDCWKVLILMFIFIEIYLYLLFLNNIFFQEPVLFGVMFIKLELLPSLLEQFYLKKTFVQSPNIFIFED